MIVLRKQERRPNAAAHEASTKRQMKQQTQEPTPVLGRSSSAAFIFMNPCGSKLVVSREAATYAYAQFRLSRRLFLPKTLTSCFEYPARAGQEKGYDCSLRSQCHCFLKCRAADGNGEAAS